MIKQIIKKYAGANQFNCFSPPVMLATFVIEVVLVLYSLMHYKTSVLSRLVATTVSLLAIFQLSEYFICEGASDNALGWARLGFIVITFLPILAVHIVLVIAKQKNKALLWLGYGLAVAWIGMFVAGDIIVEPVCFGNYAILALDEPGSLMYEFYYWGWLAVGMILALKFSNNTTRKIRKLLNITLVGYMTFIIPMGVILIIDPSLLAGAPSIMCGFALMFALILVLKLEAEKEKG